MKEKGKRLTKKIIFLIVILAIIAVIFIVGTGLQVAFICAENIVCWHPDYDKIDISGILNKSRLTDEDYEILYAQTGLTKIGVDRMLANGNAGRTQILLIQNDYFTEHEVKHDLYAPFICTDYIENDMTSSYLKEGDIVVTSSTHFSGWRMGHSGLVTNGSTRSILQATAIGTESVIGSMRDFTNRVNFIILSPKVSDETKAQVVEFALDNLVGKVYNPTIGVFSGKTTIESTQCAHLVWYAYNQFGVDLDCNGGLVVSPRDLANSPYVDVVQVFGFDPIKLWK